tara:strand:+ start:682 stop:831 length:150 start_codon:yes stop_codon:yes gene_type:complete
MWKSRTRKITKKIRDIGAFPFLIMAVAIYIVVLFLTYLVVTLLSFFVKK